MQDFDDDIIITAVPVPVRPQRPRFQPEPFRLQRVYVPPADRQADLMNEVLLALKYRLLPVSPVRKKRERDRPPGPQPSFDPEHARHITMYEALKRSEHFKL